MIVLQENWNNNEAWDGFIENQPEARFSHLSSYGGVVDCYGYTPRNICFLKGDEIIAALPAVQASSLIFGRRWISQPFSEYGGILISDTATEEEVNTILSLLKDYAAKKGIEIEMHGNYGVPEAIRQTAFQSANEHAIAFLDIRDEADNIWKNVISYEARKAVNKATRAGIKIVDKCTSELIRDSFYPLYLQSMKRLGAPPHSIDYYLNSQRLYKDKMIILWAVLDDTKIAALLGFACGKRISIINIVSDPAFWNHRPNDLLHWQFICKAIQEGYEFFDFGSVRYGGQEHFKKKWGCQMTPYAYYFLSKQADSSAPRTFNSSSAFMKKSADLWNKHVPIGVTAVLGPIIRKHLTR